MKAIIILSGLVFSLILGFFPSISKKKSTAWKITVISLVSLTIFLSIYPPLVTDFNVARAITQSNPDKVVNVIWLYNPGKKYL
jgi:ABC-type amino acid transport system permease subunit